MYVEYTRIFGPWIGFQFWRLSAFVGGRSIRNSISSAGYFAQRSMPNFSLS